MVFYFEIEKQIIEKSLPHFDYFFKTSATISPSKKFKHHK